MNERKEMRRDENIHKRRLGGGRGVEETKILF